MGDDFEAILIVEANRQFGRPSERDCRSVRETYGLTHFKVLYDPTGELERLGLGERHAHRVLRTGSILEFSQNFRDDGFRPVLERLLR